MRIGRLYIQRLHRQEHWWQGGRVTWVCKPRPGDPSWRRRVRYIQIEVQ